jgi:hypothetical protein
MKKLFLDRVLYTAILTSLILVGCMPDSVTKFKEDTPTKTSTSSSSSGSSSSSDSDSSSTSTEIVSFDYFQIGGTDRLVLKLTDPNQLTGYTVGDTLYVSETYPLDSAKGILNIVSIDTDREEMLVDITSPGTNHFVTINDYIDNCGSGFAGCLPGASTGAQVSSVAIYLDRTDTSASLTRSPVTDPVSASDFVFSISPTPPLGMSFSATTGQISMPVVPFLAPELDNEAFTVKVTNGDGDSISHQLKFSTVKSNQYTLKYDFIAADRIVLEVDDANGFANGNTVYACTSSLFSACDTAAEYVGDATIYHVDTDSNPNRVYITIGAELEFANRYYIHISDGSFTAQVIDEPIRLYNTTDTPTISATITPDPTLDGITTLFTSSPGIAGGLTLNSSTGDITTTGTLEGRIDPADGTYTVLVKNQTTGATLASKELRVIVVDPPTSLAYEFPSPQVYNIGVNINANRPLISGLPNQEDTTFFTLTGGPLPAGLEFDTTTGNISGAPTEYDSGSNYTINAFHAQSGSTAFDTYTMNITTASEIRNIFMRQNSGDKLILTMSGVSGMTSNDNLTTDEDSTVAIDYIDATNKKVYVTVSANYTGKDVIKAGDPVDISSAFVSEKAKILKVVHEFKTTDDLTGGAITNDIYDENGIVNLATGETVTYSISPQLPSDMTFNTTTGTITGNSAAGQSAMNETEYAISVTNSISETKSFNYNMQISQDPIDLSVAELQFLHVNSVASSRFFKGMTISNSAGYKGVVVDTYVEGGNILGIVSAFTGEVEPETGIDNKETYFSAETTVKERIFIYTDAIDNFTVSGDISTADGDSGTIIAIAAEAGGGATTGSGRILIETDPGAEFAIGESIDNTATFAAQEGIVTSVSKQNHINLILTVSDSDNFPTGSYISTAAGDKGLVVWNDTANEKLFVRLISGQFSDGEGVDDVATHAADADTIVTVDSVYLDLTLASNAIFSAGEPVTAESGGYQATGKVINVGSSNDLTVLRYDGIFEDADNLDDLNPYNYDTSGTTTTISDVANAHTFVFYVDSPGVIKSYTRGTVSEYSITPSLPQGMALNTLTGEIEGAPTETKGLTTYTLTARNGSTTVTHQFDILILSQFRLTHSKSSTSSYVFHVEGQGNDTTGCMITSDQVSESNTSTKGVNDIDCVLEAGEMDLNTNGFNFRAIVSAGLCEYVSYFPFTYNDFPSINTDAEFDTFVFEGGAPDTVCTASVTGDGVGSVIVAADVMATGVVDSTGAGKNFGETYCTAGTNCTAGTDVSVPACLGDHTAAGGPNCDGGEYKVNTYTCKDDGNSAGDCVCTLTTATTTCDGEAANCIAGPYEESGLSYPNSFKYTESFSGLNQDYNVAGKSGRTTNIYHSNYSLGMGCFETGSSNYLLDTDNWNGNLAASSASTNGFGSVSPFEGIHSNKFYTFHCLDAAFDTKARIRVVIRDWDRSFVPGSDALDILDNTTTKMDDSGTCFGTACDFRTDWDAIAGGLADYASCAHNGTAAATGTVALTAGSRIVTGTGTAFTTELVAGQAIQIYDNDYVVTAIASDTSLTLSAPAIQTVSGETMTRYMDFPFPLDR